MRARVSRSDRRIPRLVTKCMTSSKDVLPNRRELWLTGYSIHRITRRIWRAPVAWVLPAADVDLKPARGRKFE